MNNNYIVYHPGTGTILAMAESVLVPVSELPPDVDDWEEYLKSSDSYTAVPVELCRFDLLSMDIVIEDELENGATTRHRQAALTKLNNLSRQELNDRLLLLVTEQRSLASKVELLRNHLLRALITQEIDDEVRAAFMKDTDMKDTY